MADGLKKDAVGHLMGILNFTFHPHYGPKARIN